ncbi:hypothetical protein [Clostridium sp.]|uniref:hypothetical protein n=1 Tax=Clostridium sp. TaxID=1506 RepID=UPI0032180B68
MKISTKLGAMILLIILNTGILMFFTLSSLNNIFAKVDEHQTKNTPLMITTLSLQKDIVQIQQWLTDISVTRANRDLMMDLMKPLNFMKVQKIILIS